jgi:PAS domain S-box-containing protein
MIDKHIRTLLLVEDETILAISKQKDLEKIGYNVFISSTGEKAVELCKNNNKIDLILMDIDLGKGIDGTKAAELILKEKYIPVVFLSSHTEPEIVDKTEKITSYGYVVKSSSITVLNASIRMAFKLFDAHKKIDESEKKYRDLYENSPLGYQSLSEKGNFVEVNPALCKLLGYQKDELLNEWVGKILSPESIETLNINFPQFKETGKIHQIPFNYINKCGEVIPVEIDGNASYDTNGNFKQTHCIIRDITVRKKAEDALLENKEKFTKAFFDHPVAMQIINIKTGQRIEMNENCVNLFGIEKKGFQKGNIYTNNIAVDPKSRKMIIDKLIQNNKITNIPLDIVTSTGEIRSLLASGSILDIKNRELGIFSYVNVTHTKKTEIDLKTSEEKYRRLVENLSGEYFFYTHDANGINTYISPSIITMLGYSQDEMLTHYSNLLTNNPINNEVYKKTEESIKGIKQAPYPAEIFHKDGSKRLLELSETPIFNADRKVISIEGIAHDITDRNKTEKEIKGQLTEKETILKETHHRIKNNFAAIGSLLSMQMLGITNPEAISILQDALGRINSMQVLYEKLLITENYHITSAKEYLNNLIDDIINLFPKTMDITVEKQIDNFQLNQKRLVPVGIIVNELLTNVMKYAFTEASAGTVTITVKENLGEVSLIIKDNGAGLPEGFDINKSKNFGLMLVKMLSKQLEGNFALESNNGTRSVLDFSL